MTTSTKNEKIVIGVEPAFLNQQEAGRYLGRSGEWLRQMAIRHDLYKPSDGIIRKGTPARYCMAHLRIIVQRLLNPGIITDDDAYRKWIYEKASGRNSLFVPAKEQGTRRKSKKP